MVHVPNVSNMFQFLSTDYFHDMYLYYNPFLSAEQCFFVALLSELRSTLAGHTMCHKSALGSDRAANGFLNAAVSTLVTLLIISLCTASECAAKKNRNQQIYLDLR